MRLGRDSSHHFYALQYYLEWMMGHKWHPQNAFTIKCKWQLTKNKLNFSLISILKLGK
jgi:hypothetical protein